MTGTGWVDGSARHRALSQEQTGCEEGPRTGSSSYSKGEPARWTFLYQMFSLQIFERIKFYCISLLGVGAAVEVVFWSSILSKRTQAIADDS